MGVDPRLNGRFPSVDIRGERYHFGKDPESGQWVVSHRAYGKWCWCFDTEREMVDFLDNLPDSADPPVLNGGPIWLSRGLIPEEEYDRRWAEHAAGLARLLEERRRTGTTFPYRGGR